MLALNELATNAGKHGALSVEGGEVRLRCGLVPGGRLELCWTEAGGPPVSAPKERRGFGARLLERALPSDLGPGAAVSLRFAPGGLEARIGFNPAGPGQPPQR